MKARRFALGLLLACALASLACGLERLADPNDRLMGDDEMIARFRAERAAFDSLATMLGEDSSIQFMDGYATSIDNGGSHAHHHDPGAQLPGITSERWNTYERLLRRIRVGRNVWPTADGILFQQYVQKFGPPETRWMRGYYFARQPLPDAQVVETDLVKAPSSAKAGSAGTTLHRHLDGPWYLYSNHGYGSI